MSDVKSHTILSLGADNAEHTLQKHSVVSVLVSHIERTPPPPRTHAQALCTISHKVKCCAAQGTALDPGCLEAVVGSLNGICLRQEI